MANSKKIGWLLTVLGIGLTSLTGCAADAAKDAEPYVQVEGSLRGGSPKAEDVARRIEAAVSALDGANPALTKRITVGEAPEAVRGALTKASEQIKARRFAGTDYVAWVEGIYVVYASPAKDRVVAYVVHGLGSGEPDYNDGLVIGFDGEGRRIYEHEDGG
jgi:hypothetical protein